MTKALEKPDKPIPLMNDFIRVMAGYADFDDVILTTLAELENAGVFESKCPEAEELARRVVGNDRSPETKGAFKTAMAKRPPESIEQLLTNALAKDPSAGGPSGTALVIRFNYAINRFFSLLNWNVGWEPLKRFLRDQFRRHPLERNVHTFVTFNYDLILDRCVQAVAKENWSPFTGYGFIIGWYLVGGGNDPVQFPAWVEHIPSDQIRILKPHGSLNWLVPQDRWGKTGDTGYLLKGGPALIPLGEHGEIRYCEWVEPKAILFSNNHGESMAVCIIPPTDPAKRVTLGFIEGTRCMERKAIEEADEVYILGWSMPRSDKDQRLLIAQAIAERERPISQVIAVNKHAGEDYFDDVRQLFGNVNVTKHNNGFREFVGGG